MPSVAHRPITAPFTVEPSAALSGGTARAYHPLDADRIDFDAWLLPPLPVTSAERAIRFVSTVAGPIAFVATAALGIIAIF